jgi:hypothetical protein
VAPDRRFHAILLPGRRHIVRIRLHLLQEALNVRLAEAILESILVHDQRALRSQSAQCSPQLVHLHVGRRAAAAAAARRGRAGLLWHDCERGGLGALTDIRTQGKRRHFLLHSRVDFLLLCELLRQPRCFPLSERVLTHLGRFASLLLFVRKRGRFRSFLILCFSHRARRRRGLNLDLLLRVLLGWVLLRPPPCCANSRRRYGKVAPQWVESALDWARAPPSDSLAWRVGMPSYGRADCSLCAGRVAIPVRASARDARLSLYSENSARADHTHALSAQVRSPGGRGSFTGGLAASPFAAPNRRRASREPWPLVSLLPQPPPHTSRAGPTWPSAAPVHKGCPTTPHQRSK